MRHTGPVRFFNTAGPVVPEDHYHIPALERLELDEVLLLIRQKKYFVLHAPRQTGKTSALLALADELNRGGDHRAVYVNVEIGQSAREDVGAAMRAILRSLASAEEDTLGERRLAHIWPEALAAGAAHDALKETLRRWARADRRPLVLMIDEIDALVGDTLLSVLRQLRAGYPDRPAGFPQSVILCGVRDVRDYRIHSSAEKAVIAGGSAFNIKAESLRLGDFSPEEVDRLLLQHTGETGQEWTAGALEAVRDFTRGQPWLVNALAYEACFRNRSGRDRSRPITVEAIRDARERLILRRETHLDQLTDKLQEERVQRVIEPLLNGVADAASIPADDLQYVRDLGLLRAEGPAEIANPIYREVIPRDLTWTTQMMTFGWQQPAWYIGADGRLRVAALLSAFQEFFREHSEHWLERFQYREAGPQLLLQAFCQRIVNAGGRIEREYGLGRRRADLLILWKVGGGSEVQRAVIECKLVRGSPDRVLRQGLEQTRAYLDRCGAGEGHLVLFDRTAGRSWEEKVFRREETAGGATITVWGM